MYFLNLPFSLLSSSFLLFASAVPVSSTELTPDTFGPTVEKGLWFIEHFSPYCSHCTHFKPTWDKLVVEAGTEIPSVKLATINCITYGDLCEKNGVGSWPTLLMFENGKIVDQFGGARDMDALKTFIKRHVKDEPLAEPTPEFAPKAIPPKQPPKPILNPSGEVLALTGDSFSPSLAKGPAFVKFFAPWCGHCKKLAPTWKQLARHMQGKVTVAEVNCDDHGSLCKSQGIQGYPTLVWYGQGDSANGRSEYMGGRKLDQLKEFSETASAAGVRVLEKAEDLDGQVAKDDVVYLLLHSASDTSIIETIREASAPLLGTPQILASSDPALYTRFSVSSPWAIVVIKDHDTQLPSSTFYHASPSSDLRKWLLTHRLPTSLELTRDTFQSVMNAPQAPLVVIAAGPLSLKEKIMQRLRDVGKKWRVRTDGTLGVVHGREIVFAWMDGGEWAEWMKSMYGIQGAGVHEGKEGEDELEDTQVVIADHSKLIYYDSDREGNPIKFTSSGSLFAAIEDAAAGKSAYKNSENFVERIARIINTKMLAIETFVANKPLQAVLLFLFSIVVVFYVLSRLVGNDVAGAQQGQTEWREYKGKNGRLD
ncbi:thioredoxin domain-containing 5 [Flammula alnicola]|nr:thioredoxin domain-containing 5 [Flammula alnicola]